MTDEEKVLAMYAIRCTEMPVDEVTAARIKENLLHPGFTYYHSLLKMYNERFPESN